MNNSRYTQVLCSRCHKFLSFERVRNGFTVCRTCEFLNILDRKVDGTVLKEKVVWRKKT
jgi:transposase